MPVEGQTSNTYQITSVDASINGAAFYCFVQNVAGNTQSSVCTVTALSKPVLTQDVSTTSQTLTEGDTIALTAGATGAAGIQWYYKKGDEAPKPVDGATTAEQPERFAGKRVLIIDDIVTTGATLAECSRTLLQAGASDVVYAAFAAPRIQD